MRVQNNHKHIIRDGKEIGYLQLIKDSGSSIPELEYLVDEYYQNQGIMSIELPKYLHEMSCKGINKLLALVKNNNTASIKLLKKYGGKLSSVRDIDCYIIINELN